MRRLTRLRRHLATTLTGFADATLERKFGTHVYQLTRELLLSGQAERDLAGRLRLTPRGRNAMREVA
jgi:hypothetical protein